MNLKIGKFELDIGLIELVVICVSVITVIATLTGNL